MGVISLVGKIVLVVANLALLLLSLAMFIIGCIIVSGRDVYNSIISTLEDQLKSSTSQLGTTVDTGDLTLTKFILPAAYALIALGIVIGSISFLGIIAGCCTYKIILIVYLIATAVLFVVQVIFVSLAYGDKSTLDGMLKPYLRDTLDDFAGIEGSDATSLSWNAIMNYEKCCGVDDYTDFQGLSKWPASINSVSYSLSTPVICCKTKSTTYTCATNPTDATSYWKTGCYDKVFDLIMNNPMSITVVVFLLLIQFVLIFFTWWILHTMNNTIDII